MMFSFRENTFGLPVHVAPLPAGSILFLIRRLWESYSQADASQAKGMRRPLAAALQYGVQSQAAIGKFPSFAGGSCVSRMG